MNELKRTLRRIGAVLWTAVAMICIAAGILVGLGRLLMPFAPHLEPHIESWLTERFDQPVQVTALGAVWETSGPVLRLAGVRIGGEEPDEQPLLLEQAEVAVNPLGWILPRIPVTSFRIARTDLVLERTAGDRFRLEGLGGAQGAGGGDTLEWLLTQGRISLVECTLTLRDRKRDLVLRFSDIDVTLENQGLQHRLAGRLQAAQEAGEIGFQLELNARASRRGISSARLYLEGSDISLHRWLAGVPLADVDLAGGVTDFRVWGDWGRQGPERFEGVLALRDLALGGARMDASGAVEGYSADRLGATVLWEREADGWRLSGENVVVARDGARWDEGGFTLARDATAWRFGIDHARLEDVAGLLRELPVLPETARGTLAGLAPSGEIRGLQGSYEPDRGLPEALTVTGQLRGVSWSAHTGLPGVTGLSGAVDSRGGSGSLVVRSDAMELDYPRLFRGPIDIEDVRTRVGWRALEAGWRLDVPRLRLDGVAGPRVRGRLRLDFPDDGSRPFIDLRARVSGADAALAGDYLPARIMHPDLVGWLDRAVVGGELVSARAMAYGDLAHWPFDRGPGRFEVRGRVRDAVLDYREDWPRLEDTSARLLFQGRRMHVEGESGRVFGIRADRLEARIGDLGMALLEVDVSGAGSAGDLLRFVRESPLERNFRPWLTGLTASGRGSVRTRLELPLREALKAEEKLDGTVTLDDVRLRNAEWGIAFDEVAGRVDFDQAGFVTDGVTGNYADAPVSLWLSVGDDKFPDAVGRARVSGALTAEALLSDFPLARPLADYVAGAPECELRLSIPRVEPGQDPRATLTLSTDLTGLAVNLPAPLAKTADERVPLNLTLPLPYEDQPFTLHYGERLAAHVHPGAEDGFRGRAHLGNTLPALPGAPGLLVDGHAELLDLDGWLSLGALAAGDNATPPVREVAVSADRVVALERTFGELTLEARPDGDRWRVAVDGPEMSGSLVLPNAGGGGLVADFRHLTLPPAKEGEPAPVIDPGELPPLHMVIERFTMGDTTLGRTRLEAYPIRDGMRVDMLRTQSDALTLQADGDWTATGDEQHSDFDLTMTAESLGKMLSEFGYAGLVEGGQTMARMDVTWPGAPADFDLARASGDLRFNVGEGRIMPVDPGAGRIFGLLSLQALPRRLMLDFSDMFQTGLAFDSIQGSFRFSEGHAHTEDLTLAGPSALIRVVGRVGLAARDYDQEVTVLPTVGNTLPLVGALAGGPAGAATMFVLQTIFERQLSEMTRYRYAITGSWEEPQVRQLDVTEPPYTGAGDGVRP